MQLLILQKTGYKLNRSHDFGSADITGINFDAEFGLKYYKDGTASAIQQSKKYFKSFQ